MPAIRRVLACSAALLAVLTLPVPPPAAASPNPNITVRCTYSHTNSDDPIVFPGQPGASHSHDFFGNVSTDAYSTVESLGAAGSTCDLDGDHSGYWTPSVLVGGHLVRPDQVTAYYTVKDPDSSALHPYPRGLRVIAGDSRSSTPQSLGVTSWSCASDNDRSATVPSCGAGDHLTLRVNFPECWDGENLDSADHKSHMAHHSLKRGCPDSHPVLVPKLSLVAHYPTRGGSGTTLASGGQFSGHADFFNAWNTQRFAELVTKCLVQQRDCRDGSVRVTGARAAEGGSLRFAVGLDEPNPFPVTVTYRTRDKSALAGSDYVSTTGTVTIPAGATSATVSVPTIESGTPEDVEEMNLELTDATNASIADGLGLGTIDDDDALPVVRVLDATTSEPLSGGRTLRCELRLDRASAVTTTVDFRTVDDSATAPADYTAATGSIRFQAGTTTATASLSVRADADFTEGDETFRVVLASPAGLTIGDGTAVVTITDPAVEPKVTIADATASEGNNESFAVTLNGPTSHTVSVSYRTFNGSAGSADFPSRTGTVSIAPGHTTATIVVPTTEDALSEREEGFRLEITSAVGATVMGGVAVGTIVDDDPLPSVRVSDASVVEPTSGTRSVKLRVSLSAVSGQPVTVSWTTADGTATAPSDYAAASGSFTIPAGSTFKDVTVDVRATGPAEPTETFQVRIVDATAATIADGAGVVSITQP